MFWEALGEAFLWFSVAAVAAVVIAIVVGMFVVARRPGSLPPWEEDRLLVHVAPAGDEDDPQADEKATRAQLDIMAANLKLEAERKQRAARNVRAVLLMILALWILGPLIWAFIAYAL